MRGIPRSPWLRASLVVPFLAAVVVLLWWRGPDWNVVYHAFDLVNWAWIAFAFGLNLGSVLLRSLAWRLTIDQALDPPHPRFNWVFSAFAVGLLANAVLPGRIGELARVAVLRRRLPHGSGTSGLLVGTVFAHRLFDLFPALLLVAYVISTARIPHWAATSLIIVSVLGTLLFTAAVISARRRHDRPSLDGAHALRRLLAMARQGLSVLRSPLPAAGAIVLQCAGWFLQLLAVYVAMRAFDIHAPLPAAALVLLLMNVATIFPLWPGNIGLLQAAVALPLVEYGVAYSTGFAYALVLQVDRDVGRRRRRPDLPRARGPLVRHAARDAGRRPSSRSRRSRAPARGGPCARWRVRLASRASSPRRRPPPRWRRASEQAAPRLSSSRSPTAARERPRSCGSRAAASGGRRTCTTRSARPRTGRWLLLPDGTAVVEAAAAVPLDPAAARPARRLEPGVRRARGGRSRRRAGGAPALPRRHGDDGRRRRPARGPRDRCRSRRASPAT